MMKSSNIINKYKKNNFILLLVLFFAVFSFFEVLGSHSQKNFKKEKRVSIPIQEVSGEYTVDFDVFLIDYLTKIILQKNINNSENEEFENILNKFNKQENNNNRNILDQDCLNMLEIVNYLSKTEKQDVLSEELFLYLIDFSFKLLKDPKDYNKNIRCILDVFKRIGIQTYYTDNVFFQNKIEGILSCLVLLTNSYDLRVFFNNEYVTYLKNLITVKNKLSDVEIIKAVLSSENNIQCYQQAIIQLFQEANFDKKNLIDHILAVAPFLLHYSIESPMIDSQLFFKDIWSYLPEDKKCPEKKIIEKKIKIEAQDIVDIIVNYIEKIQPTPKELINLLYFLQDFIGSSYNWSVIYSSLLLKSNQEANRKKILEFFDQLDFDFDKKVFFMPIVAILEDNDNFNPYEEEFNRQYNTNNLIKYKAIEQIEKQISNCQTICCQIRESFSIEEASLERDYQNWKNQLCRDKNNELEESNSKDSILTIIGKFCFRMGSRILKKSDQSLKEDLKEKMINEICNDNVPTEYKPVVFEPTVVIHLPEEVDQTQEFYLLYDNFELLQNRYIEMIDKEKDNIINNHLIDFNKQLEKIFEEEKKTIQKKGNEKIVEKKQKINDKKVKREQEANVQYDKAKEIIKSNQEASDEKKKLEEGINLDLLFEVNSRFETLKNIISSNFLPKNNPGVLKKLYRFLFYIFKYNKEKSQDKKIEKLKYYIESVFQISFDTLNENQRDSVYSVLVRWHEDIFKIESLSFPVIKEIIKMGVDDIAFGRDIISIIYSLLEKKSIIDILSEILKEANDNENLDCFEKCKVFYTILYENDTKNSKLDFYLGLFELLNKIEIFLDSDIKKLFYNRYSQLIIDCKVSLINESWQEVILKIEENTNRKNKILFNINILSSIFNLLKDSQAKQDFFDYIFSQKKDIISYCNKNQNDYNIDNWKKRYQNKLLQLSETIQDNKEDRNKKIKTIFAEDNKAELGASKGSGLKKKNRIPILNTKLKEETGLNLNEVVEKEENRECSKIQYSQLAPETLSSQKKIEEVIKEESQLIKEIQGRFDTLKNILQYGFINEKSMCCALCEILLKFNFETQAEKIELLKDIYNKFFDNNQKRLDDPEVTSLFGSIAQEVDLLFKNNSDLDTLKDFFSVILFNLLFFDSVDDCAVLLNRVIQSICCYYEWNDDCLLEIVKQVVKKIQNSKKADKDELTGRFYLIFQKNYKAVYGEKIFQANQMYYPFIFKILNAIRSKGLTDVDYFNYCSQFIVSIKKQSNPDISWGSLFDEMKKKTNNNIEADIIKNIFIELYKDKSDNHFKSFYEYIDKNTEENLKTTSLKELSNEIKEKINRIQELKEQEKKPEEVQVSAAQTGNNTAKVEPEAKPEGQVPAAETYGGPLSLIATASVLAVVNNRKIIVDFFGATAKGKDFIEYLFGAKSKGNKLIQYVNSFVGKDNLVLQFFDAHKRAINYASIVFFGAGVIYAIKIKKDNNKIKERLLKK